MSRENIIKNWKEDFPIFRQNTENGRRPPMIYLDSAATTQKPSGVLESFRIYEECNGNVHRAPHRWGRETTKRYERARQTILDFFGGGSGDTLIFTRGTTEGINLVASSFLSVLPKERDEVVVTVSEHHSNFVPWQQWCRKLGKRLVVIPVTAEGETDMEVFRNVVSGHTALVAAAQRTNVFGIRQPVEEMAELAHKAGAFMLVDGAQASGHEPVCLKSLGCDFYAASGHKMYGPNGIGVLIGKTELLNRMDPWQYGGEMIDEVWEEKATFQQAPYRFEAGTPDYMGAIGLESAVKYLKETGMRRIREREEEVFRFLIQQLQKREDVIFPVNPELSGGICSFYIKGMHPYDTALLLDAQNIAVRSGNHCAQPLMRAYGLQGGTVRVSLGIYNTEEDIEALLKGLDRIRKGSGI